MANKYINIYGLVSEDNPNDIKYIGVTRCNPRNRFNSHIYEAKTTPEKNKRTRWIKANNFKIRQIILDVIKEENSVFWEKFWICLIKSWGFELVNSNIGGGGLQKRSPEFSAWLSNRNLGNKYNLGKKRSDEAKQNISLGHKGIPSPNKGRKLPKEWVDKLRVAKLGSVGNATGCKHSEETKNKNRRPVLQLDLNNNPIKEWIGVREAAKNLNLNESGITFVCRGKYKSSGGFKWKYIN